MITSVCDFLERSVAKYPQKTLFVENEKSITYEDFDLLSSKIASQICKILQKQNQIPILILLPKSINTLASFFGVAKSGNFYTLLDESTPKERIIKVIEILQPQILITSKEYGNDLSSLIFQTLYMEDFQSYDLDLQTLKQIKQQHIDTNLLYVFFTSGSTGVPKGVSIAHKSVIDYTFWVCETFDLSENEILANQAPFYFDNSILDIFSTIKAGACLHLLATNLFAFPHKVLEYLEEKQISMIFWVPSVLIYFANTQALENFKLPHLKKVLFCGEIMPNKQLNIWRKELKNTLFANLYGPTEITDVCSFYIADREFKDEELLPIGKACKNTQLLVFDENLKLITPENVGTKGELFVRGTSLSLGYYNDEAKSKESFLQNPLHNAYLDLLYKTGDIVAYNEKGELLCYGRKDFQVKIAGHRVELGEIESVLNSHKNVLNSACIFKNNLLYAFYESEFELELKSFLKEKLPSYMLPKKFIKLDKFTLNQNGKIDKKALNELV